MRIKNKYTKIIAYRLGIAIATLCSLSDARATTPLQCAALFSDLTVVQTRGGDSNPEAAEALWTAVKNHLPRGVLNFASFTAELPATRGRSGDPVFILKDGETPVAAVKLYPKHPRSLDHEMLGLKVLSEANLKLWKPVKIIEAHRIQVGEVSVPVLIMKIAPGLDMFGWLRLAAKLPHEPHLPVAANKIGQALGEFHDHFRWSPRATEKEYTTVQEYIDWEISKIGSLIENQRKFDTEMLERGWATRLELDRLYERMNQIKKVLTSHVITSASYIHADLNVGNAVYDSKFDQVTVIDTQTSVSTLGEARSGKIHGSADPFNDVGRFYEDIFVKGLAVGTPSAAIQLAQAEFIRGYCEQTGQQIQFVLSQIEYYRLRLDLQQFQSEHAVERDKVNGKLLDHLLRRMGIR